jgi:diadenosine tetraphosphate (Ap4A) HIT family hydrolase
MLAGNPDYHHHMVCEDDRAVVFLNKYPTVPGYTLVAPREHREQVTGDFPLEDYLAIQQTIYHVAEAIRDEFSPERVYILSLGSQQGNRHVHWHIAPLPPGVPYEAQQCAALSFEHAGVLSFSDDEMATFASRIRQRITS